MPSYKLTGDQLTVKPTGGSNETQTPEVITIDTE